MFAGIPQGHPFGQAAAKINFRYSATDRFFDDEKPKLNFYIYININIKIVFEVWNTLFLTVAL